MLRHILLFLLFTCKIVLAESNTSNVLEESIKIDALKQKIVLIDESIKDNLWYKRYGNYLSYQKLLEELGVVDAEVKKLKNAKDKASVEKYDKLLSKQESLEKQILLLQEFKNSQFSRLAQPIEIEIYPKVTYPFSII